jgi:alpha-galactosidase
MHKNPDRALVSRRVVIQNGLLLAAGCAAARSILADDETAAAGERRSWTIGNGVVSRTIAYEPSLGLWTDRLTDLETRADYIEPGRIRKGLAEEFFFQCNGNRCAGSGPDFLFLNADEETIANAKSLTIRLRHRSVDLEVSVVYRVNDGHAAIRKHLIFRNTGPSALRLSHLAMEAIGIAIGPENEITLLTQYGTIPREIFYTGRSEDAGLLIANGRTGLGMAVLNEAPGWMKRTEIGGWDDADHVRIAAMYDTDLMPFERSLGAGEGFTTAAASLVCYRNGDGFHDPHWRLPSYAAQVLERRVDAQGPPWIYNTWEPFTRSINRDIALELIDAAGAMGMDIFTIDDGWQREYGENEIDLKSFSGGLKPIQDAVTARNMRLGLWIPVAAIGTSTEIYRSHPEWAAIDQQGNRKTTGTAAGEKAVMCMASAYRDAAAARVIDAIERFSLAYVKLDLTTVFNAYGEAPGCWAKGHYHSDWAESLGMIYEGIAAMTAAIYQRHPDVLLDLTFELWGQKHVIDAGLLAAGDLDWLSNVDDNQPGSAGPRQARQLLYQRSATMPVEAMLIGNIHAGPTAIQERFATAIGSAPLLLGDLRKLSAADRTWYGEKIAWFKKLRRTAQISESFFPLGNWLQVSPGAWDGFARLDRDGRGMIAVFRNESHDATATVRLPSIPAGKYRLRSIITGRELGAFNQSDWVCGVPIEFSADESVDILEVIPAGG